jgi:hypothetical protein
MAKKARAKHPRAAHHAGTKTSADAIFVKVVRWIYRSGLTYGPNSVRINGKPIREWALLNPDDRVEAYKVALGLIAVRKAIDVLPPDPDGSVVGAGDLLEALTKRTNSSASRFVYNIHLTHRGNPPANWIAQRDRATFTGIVLALQEAAKRDGEKLSRKKAVELAKTKCRQSSYFSYTDQALKGWIARGEVPDADEYRRLIIERAEDLGSDRTLTSRVIGIARRGITLWPFAETLAGL